MHRRITLVSPRRLRAAVAAIVSVAALAACADHGATVTAPEPAVGTLRPYASLAGVPSVFISEVHYDNTGTDQGERIEVTFPTGASLAGYALVLYNGSNGQTYTPVRTLSGLTAVACSSPSGLSTVVAEYPVDGIQNGSPDGIALVRVNSPSDTTLIEFLSYEGPMVGTNGKANGVLSNNIGVIENGSGPVGASVQRDLVTGYFAPSAANTFGACNTVSVPAPPITRVEITPSAPTSVVFGDSKRYSAAAYNGATVTTTTTIPGTAFTWSSSNPDVATVSNTGVVTTLDVGTVQITATAPGGISATATLTVGAPPSLPPVRFTELHYDNADTDLGEGIEIEAPAGTNLTGWTVALYSLSAGTVTRYDVRTLTATVPATCGDRGVVVLEYPSNGVQNGPTDGMALLDASGQLVEFLSWEGTLTATINGASVTSTDIGVSQTSAAYGTSLQRSLAGTWASGASNFYGCNKRSDGRAITGFSFSGRDPIDDPALPVGFEAQISGTARQGTTLLPFVWSSDTPNIATIDADGVIHAVAPGTAVFRATTTDGLASGTYALPMTLGEEGTLAQYAGNAAFGEPADGNASDDILIRRREYTTSFNPNRNTPNWVSYNLDRTHTATGADRCNCFTFDPELPQARRYTTAAYTGVGSTYNRGHLVRSSDRTTGSLDNARTYYFSNIVPQAADNNQGPWAAFETYLGTLATAQDKEVYIIAGVAGNIGTLKDEGKVTIPASVWKVALVLPRDQGPANVTSLSSAQVFAVIMPNVNGIRSTPWESYKTTVDAVELLSGYDLLALLRDDLETAIESNTKPPVAAIDGPHTEVVKSPITMSAAASTDPDGDALTFQWSFGDGGVATGASVTHTYATPGTFTVRLIARDTRGLEDTVTTTATVLSGAQAIGNAIPAVKALASTGLGNGNVNSLVSKLENAQKQAERGGNAGALGMLGAVLNELDAFVASGRLTESDVASVRVALGKARTALE